MSALLTSCSDLLSIDWPPHREPASAPCFDGRCHLDISARRFDPLFYHRQADAARMFPLNRRKRLKQLEDAPLVVGGDARAVIGYGDDVEPTIARHFDRHITPRAVVMLDRIAKQVA